MMFCDICKICHVTLFGGGPLVLFMLVRAPELHFGVFLPAENSRLRATGVVLWATHTHTHTPALTLLWVVPGGSAILSTFVFLLLLRDAVAGAETAEV